MLYRKKREIAAALLGICAAAILWVTVLNREVQDTRILFGKPFQILATGLTDIRRSGITGNFLGNILMFVPVGVFFPIMSGKRNLLPTAAAGFSFSLLVETVQLITARGCFEVDDLILNSFGVVIGYFICRAVTLCVKAFVKPRENASAV